MLLLRRAMFAWLTRILLALCSVIEARASGEAEILVLRQQLLVLSCKSSARPRKPTALIVVSTVGKLFSQKVVSFKNRSISIHFYRGLRG